MKGASAKASSAESGNEEERVAGPRYQLADGSLTALGLATRTMVTRPVWVVGVVLMPALLLGAQAWSLQLQGLYESSQREYLWLGAALHLGLFLPVAWMTLAENFLEGERPGPLQGLRSVGGNLLLAGLLGGTVLLGSLVGILVLGVILPGIVEVLFQRILAPVVAPVLWLHFLAQVSGVRFDGVFACGSGAVESFASSLVHAPGAHRRPEGGLLTLGAIALAGAWAASWAGEATRTGLGLPVPGYGGGRRLVGPLAGLPWMVQVLVLGLVSSLVVLAFYYRLPHLHRSEGSGSSRKTSFGVPPLGVATRSG